MVRRLEKDSPTEGEWTWDIRVIDFGLAVRVSSIKASMAVLSAMHSTRDKSITGTIKYGAPEQLGELPGVAVGPHSDVYAFGKTCLEFLFGTTEPKSWHWKGLPAEVREPLQEVLERCTTPSLMERHTDFNVVLDILVKLESKIAVIEGQASANLQRFLESSNPRRWLASRLKGWSSDEWQKLLVKLKASPYWPLDQVKLTKSFDVLRIAILEERARADGGKRDDTDSD